MLKANVSELHLCQRCPRLLAYQRRGAQDAWRVGLSGSGQMPGKLFHDRIAALFYQKMASGTGELFEAFCDLFRDPQADPESGLLALVESRFFLPLMQGQAHRLSSEQVLRLARGLERWSRYQAEFIQNAFKRHRGPPASFFQQLFHAPEHQMEAEYRLGSGQKVRVWGRYDALLFDPSAHEAALFEFKGGKSGNASEDFLQLALYGWLIQTATGVPVRGIVLHLEEDPPETCYSAARIQAAFAGLAPVFERFVQVTAALSASPGPPLETATNQQLCQSCPFALHCEAQWGAKRSERSAVSSPPPSGSRSDEKRLGWIVKILKALRLPVEPLGLVAGPRFVRFKVRPRLAEGVTVRKLMNQSENLQVELGLETAPLIQPQAGYVSIDVPRQDQQPLSLSQVWQKGRSNRPASDAAFPLGMGIDGRIFWADLADPAMSSLLVGGTSGSGKSVFLRAAALGLALNASPAQLKISLIDPKRVSFTDLAALPHLLGPPILDYSPAVDRLLDLVDAMEDRYRAFEKQKVVDLAEYQQNRVGPPLCRHVLIIDEYADLLMDKRYKAPLERGIQRLGQKGRAAGIHLILSTQRPDSKVMTPVIKANLQLKVALKVSTGANSSVILDCTGAEYLIGYGDMLIGGSVPLQRLQGPMAQASDIQAVLQQSPATASVQTEI